MVGIVNRTKVVQVGALDDLRLIGAGHYSVKR
jgi:hypothetical protein